MNDDYIAYKRASEIWNQGQYHYHDQYEVMLSMSEGAEIFIGDTPYPLCRGSLFLIPPTVRHRSIAFEQPQLYERYVLRFYAHYAEALSSQSTDLLQVFQLKVRHFQLDAEQTALLESKFEACMHRYNGYGADLRRKAAFIELILTVREIAASMSGEKERPPAGLRSNVSDMINYIPDHLQEDLSLNELSARFFISKPHLCRVFKETTGFSPGEYIIKSRVMRARTLLQDGKSVQEACIGAGFRSYAHFIRTFRQIVGVSPGKYKARES